MTSPAVSPIRIVPCRLTLRGPLPPRWSGILACYPQNLAKFRALRLGLFDGVVVHLGGQRLACDGTRHELNEPHKQTVCIGAFVAVHVENETDRWIEDFSVQLEGVAPDGGAQPELASGQAIFGALAELQRAG